MTRLLQQRKKKKCLAAINIYGIILLILLTAMRPTNAGIDSMKYIIGEKDVRGTDVILVLQTDSPIRCASICSKSLNCLGFNWVPASHTCEPLFSLRNVKEETTSTLYIPESRTPIWVVELMFSCESCYEERPNAAVTWHHNCQTNGFAVGVAATTVLSNLDVMFCAHPPGLVMDTSDGFTITDYSRDCTAFENYVVESVWSNNKLYRNSSEFHHVCRKMSSNYHVDINRCTRVAPKEGVVTYDRKESNATILRCPQHMAATSIMREKNGGDPTVDCCLIYQ